MPYCINHPDTATNLSCGSCGRIICARCTNEYKGGYICPDCFDKKNIQKKAVKDSPASVRKGEKGERRGSISLILAPVLGILVAAGLAFSWSWLSIYAGKKMTPLFLLIGFLIGLTMTIAGVQKRGILLQFICLCVALFGIFFADYLYTNMHLIRSSEGPAFILSIPKYLKILETHTDADWWYFFLGCGISFFLPGEWSKATLAKK